MNTKGQILNKRNKLVFSRWSRKSWAVFCSLGREVKIAVLKLVVADGFIKKSNAGINVHEVVRNEEMDSDDSSGDSKINPVNPLTLLLNLIQPQKIVVSGGQHGLNSVYSTFHNKAHPFLSGKDFLLYHNFFLFYTYSHSESLPAVILSACLPVGRKSKEGRE